MLRRPPNSKRTDTRFPYPELFRSDKRLFPAHSIRKPAKKYKPEQARQSAGANDQFRSGVFHALWTGKEEQRSIHGRIPDDSEPCGQTEERHKQPTLISWISKTFFQWIGRSFARFLHCLEKIGRAHV